MFAVLAALLGVFYEASKGATGGNSPGTQSQPIVQPQPAYISLGNGLVAPGPGPFAPSPASFNYVASPAGPSNPTGMIPVSSFNKITPNVTVQTPQGPVSNVTVVSAASGNGIFGIVQGGTPSQQQAVTGVLSKVNQQLRAAHL